MSAGVPVEGKETRHFDGHLPDVTVAHNVITFEGFSHAVLCGIR